jgi:hypothetical protein
MLNGCSLAAVVRDSKVRGTSEGEDENALAKEFQIANRLPRNGLSTKKKVVGG